MRQPREAARAGFATVQYAVATETGPARDPYWPLTRGTRGLTPAPLLGWMRAEPPANHTDYFFSLASSFLGFRPHFFRSSGVSGRVHLTSHCLASFTTCAFHLLSISLIFSWWKVST